MINTDPIAIVFGKIIEDMTPDILPKLQAVDANIKTVTYIHGPIDELTTTLQQMDEDRNNFDKKYPLIYLRHNIRESVGLNSGYPSESNVDIGIAHHTNKEYKTNERYEHVFIPILLPLYKALLEEILDSGYFVADELEDISHTRVDNVKLGTESFLDLDESFDFIDAIELQGLRLTNNFDNCIHLITNVQGYL